MTWNGRCKARIHYFNRIPGLDLIPKQSLDLHQGAFCSVVLVMSMLQIWVFGGAYTEERVSR